MLPWIGCDKFLMNGGRTFEETPMPTIVSPIPGTFAGQVFGVDCAAPLTGADVASIDAAMDRNAVLIFRDQPLNDEQQLTFTRRFGELERYETPGHIRKREQERLAGGIADFSNLTRDGSVMSPEDRVWLFKLGDRLWHSDSSFRPVPAKYSLLSGRTIPSRGGDTEFADMRAAYDALDQETKAEIEDLVCEHSLIHSRETIGFADITPEEREHFRPVRHPLLHDSRSENVPARSDRTRHAASIRLSSPLAAGRSRHVGQPHHDAPGSPVSTQRGSRRAPDDARRRRRGGDSRCWLLRLRSGPVCRTRIDNALSNERNS